MSKRLRLKAFFAALLFVPGLILPASAGPSLLLDPTTGDVIAQDRAGLPWYPASLTKLMTAYITFDALKNGRLKLDQRIPVSAFANSAPASKIGVPAGNTVSVDFALQSMLVYSANDMAVVLSEASGGTVSAFVQQMNETAAKLGMTGSRFVNPNGLHSPLQISTARDLGILASRIVTDFPEYHHYFEQDYVTVGKRKLSNRNMLLRLMPTVDGMKTGFTCPSGYNLIVSASDNGRRVMAILLGASSGQSRAEWAQSLLAQGFASGRGGHRLTDIKNVAISLVAPTNMSEDVCGPRRGGPLIAASALKGYGALFGRYGARGDANSLLKARVDQGQEYLGGASKGLVRLPKKGGFAAMVWGLDAPKAQSLCSYLASKNAQCEFMTPDKFAEIAEQAQAEAQARKAAAAKKKPQKKAKQ